MSAAARQATGVGERMLNEAGEFGAEALEAAQHQASQAMDSVEGRIRQNPFVSVMIAAGVGFALGLLNRK